MINNDDEVRGRLDQAAGIVKEKIGRATGDIDLETEGSAQRSDGDIEHGFGKARRKVGEAIKDIGDKLGR
jgi:uncharacterized protein YjbJ (UPF0337 family)